MSRSYKSDDPYYREGWPSPWDWAKETPSLTWQQCLEWAMHNAHCGHWSTCYWLIEASLYSKYKSNGGQVRPDGKYRIFV